MAITAKDIYWTLSEIRTKVRKLTGRPSINQISDNEIDTYVNRFYTQELMSLLDLREVSSWWRFQSMVNVPNYGNLNGNFVLEGPAYVNGNPITIYTNPNDFFFRNPMLFQHRESVGSGDGATTTFTGTLGKPVVNPENIVFDDDVEALLVQDRIKITDISQAAEAVVTTDTAHGLTTGDTIKMFDMRSGMVEIQDIQSTVTVLTTTTFTFDNVDTTSFTQYTSGGFVLPVSVAILKGALGGSGRVTLATGVFSITFNTAPTDGQALIASYEFSNTAEPNAALLYDNEIFLNPVPDGTYFIQIAVKGRPAPLISDTDSLAFDDWGKLISYGASIDIMNDNGQQEGSQVLSVEFKNLLKLAARRNIKNTKDQRAYPRF